jgi:hypothetical protein
MGLPYFERTEAIVLADLTGLSHCRLFYPILGIIKESLMKDRQKTCAHLPCGCVVPPDEKFCSESCRDAGSGEVEIECECGHATCTMAGEDELIA